jgi:hypothetical protein
MQAAPAVLNLLTGQPDVVVVHGQLDAAIPGQNCRSCPNINLPFLYQAPRSAPKIIGVRRYYQAILCIIDKLRLPTLLPVHDGLWLVLCGILAAKLVARRCGGIHVDGDQPVAFMEW